MTKKEIIELYLADLNNLVPNSEAKRSRIIDLEDELEALRIHDVSGRSEQFANKRSIMKKEDIKELIIKHSQRVETWINSDGEGYSTEDRWMDSDDINAMTEAIFRLFVVSGSVCEKCNPNGVVSGNVVRCKKCGRGLALIEQNYH